MCARKALSTLAFLAVVALGCSASLSARAQVARDCGSCVLAADCGGKRDNCVAECMARLFEIDPRRAACLDACNAKAAQCTRTADDSCRAQNRCQ